MILEQQWTPARATIASIPVDYTAVPLAELIDACARGENAAWEKFIQRYHRIIALTASRVAWRWREYSPSVVDDLVQETYLKLCADRARVLREFRFNHADAIFGFLKVVTANVATDYFKKLHNLEHGGGLTVPLEEDMEPATCAEGSFGLTPPERSVLLDEVDAYLSVALPPEIRDRDRTIFWLYHRQGLTAEQIAALPLGLTVKGVESALRRLLRFVRACMVESERH